MPELQPARVYSPVKHRYSLAAIKITEKFPVVLDVGGYRSRKRVLEESLGQFTYISANVGSAWYDADATPDVICSGSRLPFHDEAFPNVISVDTLEHIERRSRATFINEMVRVARVRVILVVPIFAQDPTDESVLLEHSKRYGVAPMPSLLQHELFRLPSSEELGQYVDGFNAHITYASPRRLYWSFQMAMLFNTISLTEHAESANKAMYNHMERHLALTFDNLQRADAYRAVVVINKIN